VFGGAAPGLVATRAEETVGYGDLSEDENVRRLLRERPEASCSSSPLYRWERKCSGEQLNAAFRASGIGSNVGRAKQLEVTSRSPGGRVTGLRVMGTSGSVALDLQQVRSVLNHIPGDLPSTLFAIDVTRGAGGVVTGLHLWGGGSGHGAGMCQFCAMALARKGTTYDTILNRYYAGSRLVTLGGEPCR
jgi:SpoIID/LytB domain protein